jgi:hypothetical protein
MAKDTSGSGTPDPQASSTNVILAQILAVAQDNLKTSKAILVAIQDSQHTTDDILKAQQAALLLAKSSNDLLTQIADSIGGGGVGHVYTVKVIQVEKQPKP